MNRYLLIIRTFLSVIIVLLIICNSTFAQKFDDSIYYSADEMPTFKDGEDELSCFIIRNLNYPEDALKAEVGGRVILAFVVEKDGKISSVSKKTLYF